MATENEVQQDEEVVEQTAQDILDEEAGFNASFGVEPPAEEAAGTDDTETDDSDEPAADPEEDTVETQEAEEADPEEDDGAHQRLTELLDGLPSLQERSQMTEQQVRQLNGKIGEINRIVKGLQDRPNATVTKDSFKRLQSEFPEIAEILAEDLNGLAFGGQSVDVEPIVQQRVQAATEKLERQMEMRLLTMAHRDWKAVTASEEFRSWVATQPQDDQQKLAESWDADYISEKLTEFKAHSTARQKQSTNRNRRLAEAILPKGRPVPKKALVTEDDGFNAAFQTR